MENNETSPAKHKFRIIMSEVRTWWTDVEADNRNEAAEKSEMLADSDWSIGDSDFEIDDVQQLTADCECGAVMHFDDLNECWNCEECHTARA